MPCLIAFFDTRRFQPLLPTTHYITHYITHTYTMAWRCSATTNTLLIQNLSASSLISHPLAVDALLRVDRAHYAPRNPYDDRPQSIGHGATISAPHMHATALSELAPFLAQATGGALTPRRALDVGSGSGFLTHAMAELCLLSAEQMSPSTPPLITVIGIDHTPQLIALSTSNLSKSARGEAHLSSRTIRFRAADGRAGYIDTDDGTGGPGARYDAIHVGAAAAECHAALLEQLNSPGRMFIPLVDDFGEQHVWRIEKDAEGQITRKKLFGVKYVPLTDAAYYEKL